MAILSNKEFAAKITGLKRSASSIRTTVDVLLQSGFAQAKEHGNLGQLSKIMTVAVAERSINSLSIKDYIQAHANVKWTKNKDGDMVFAKDGGKQDKLEVSIPTVAWFDHETNAKNQAKPDMDAMAQAKALLKRITTAIGEGKVKDPEAAVKMRDALKTALEA
jgi:hypothetical protein